MDPDNRHNSSSERPSHLGKLAASVGVGVGLGTLCLAAAWNSLTAPPVPTTPSTDPTEEVSGADGISTESIATSAHHELEGVLGRLEELAAQSKQETRSD